MGTFTVNVGIGRLGGGELTPLEAMVDTGAAHSVMPASLFARLHVEPLELREYALADGRIVEMGYGMVNVSIEGRELPCPVIFSSHDEYLLGSTTLEILT
jgi:clan AA aspartic protease